MKLISYFCAKKMKRVSTITKRLILEYGRKRCSWCNTIKDISEFGVTGPKNTALGYLYNGHCNACRRLIRTKRYAEVERDKLGHKKQNRDKNLQKQRRIEYYHKNKERLREKKSQYSKKYYKRNKYKYRAWRKAYVNKSPENKLRARLGVMLCYYIKKVNSKKQSSILDYIGCSTGELRVYLESKFTEGMSWDNYGKWHIDHIKPCSSFNHANNEEVKKCWHYTNLQPLWALDNMRKGNR